MGRYRGKLCKMCRREGTKLYLKGIKCDTAHCTLERRNFPPGQHGKRRKKISEYALQLREKQKLRRMYNLMEEQFRIYFAKAHRSKGVTGEVLLQLLEMRLDNVVYRLGIGTGRRGARQFITHGHILVNGKRVDIPSYLVKTGDVISIRDKENSHNIAKDSLELTESREVPEWLQIDKEKIEGRIMRLPTKDDIQVPIDESMIVEFYSKV